MTIMHVVYDKVSKRYLKGTVWYARDDTVQWTTNINEARRYKNPQIYRVRRMTKEHQKFMTSPVYANWLAKTVPNTVEFVSVPVEVED